MTSAIGRGTVESLTILRETPWVFMMQIDHSLVKKIAFDAGAAILGYYQTHYDVQIKADDTPVTEADRAASQIIENALSANTSWPVLSEESALPDWDERRHWSRYWLVDPLDGTREFVKGSGDFTVNIALVHHNRPVFGLVHAPVTGDTWWAAEGKGAWYARGDDTESRQRVVGLPERISDWVELGSRTHSSDAVEAFRTRLGPHTLKAVGSSIKMCQIASGQAHIYARLGPTSEWDTAAAQVVLEEAGGVLLSAETLAPLSYNRTESLLNPFFVAASDKDERWIRALPSRAQG